MLSVLSVRTHIEEMSMLFLKKMTKNMTRGIQGAGAGKDCYGVAEGGV